MSPKAVNISSMRLLKCVSCLITLSLNWDLELTSTGLLALRCLQNFGSDKNGINKMVRNCSIPHYLKEKKVYFFEDELVKWVEKDRVPTFQEKYSNRKLR